MIDNFYAHNKLNVMKLLVVTTLVKFLSDVHTNRFKIDLCLLENCYCQTLWYF